MRGFQGKNLFLFHVIFLFIPIFFLYTNCKYDPGISASPTRLFSSMEGGGAGNGEPFEGKLYNRKVPGNSCGGQTMPLGQIKIDGSLITLTKNSAQACDNSAPIKAENLLLSKNTDLVLAYQDGLYVKQMTEADQNSEVFTEAWCRTTSSLYGNVDAVVMWGQDGKAASLQLFSEKANEHYQSSQVYRKLIPGTVSYGSNQAYLEIAYSQSLPNQPYERKGSLMAQLSGQLIKLDVLCRMGGQFDSQAPAFKYSMDQDIFALQKPIEKIIPSVSHPVLKYSIYPELPMGLNLDVNTGVISGVPSALIPSQLYQVEATLKFGSISTVLELGVGREISVTSFDIDSGALINKIKQSSPFPSIVKFPDETIYLKGKEIVFSGEAKFIGQSKTVLDGEGRSRLLNVSGNSKLILQSLRLTNGFVLTKGGAIYSENSSIMIDHVHFDHNSVGDNNIEVSSKMGGAIYSEGGVLSIKDSVFEDNSVPWSGANLYGGAIAIHQPNKLVINIVSTRFSRNSAAFGGAVYATGSNTDQGFNFSNCEFIQNSAISGGGILIGLGLVTVKNSSFSQNAARLFGGALATGSVTGMSIEASSFQNNTANLGSALYFSGLNQGSALVLKSSQIRRSQIYSDNGVILNED